VQQLRRKTAPIHRPSDGTSFAFRAAAAQEAAMANHFTLRRTRPLSSESVLLCGGPLSFTLHCFVCEFALLRPISLSIEFRGPGHCIWWAWPESSSQVLNFVFMNYGER
jgi:hypothetical protein